MPSKRRRSKPIDLIAGSSDSDEGPSDSTSASTINKKKKKKPSAAASRGAVAPGKHTPVHQLTASQKLAAASPWLAPRSKLFGGSGSGVEKREKRHLELDADGHLREEVPGSGRRKKGGKKGKKRKKRTESEDSDEESDEDGSDEEKAATLAGSTADVQSIFGTDPDKTVARAMVASSSMQLPWVPTRFATPKVSKPRQVKITQEPKPDENGETLDNKKRKRGGPSTSRIYGDKIPLFLLHGEELAECKQLVKWKNVKTHKPDVELQDGKQGGLNANFALLTCRDTKNRLFLRFVVFTAALEAQEWGKTESALWLQDFPFLLADSLTAPAHNPTHTRFSSSLFRFLTSPALSLDIRPEPLAQLKEQFKHFEFSTSADVQLVSSLAGTWEGEEETPFGTLPPAKFLARFYAACTSIPPLEYMAGSTARAKSAAKAFTDADNGQEKVVLVYPTVDAVAATQDGKGEGGYRVKWEGPDYYKAEKERRGVLRQCELKSGRINHSTMILILHQPFASDQREHDDEQYEAFLYVGSHKPSSTSWGSYSSSSSSLPSVKLSSHDLGVLYRCATSSTWKGLLDQVNDIVPYERPLKRYERNDEPAPTEERPLPKAKGEGGGKGKGKASGKGKRKRGEEVSE
ncbi:hypothetical protein JCM11641_008353 [Rhodosporidiobolus odoratus]